MCTYRVHLRCIWVDPFSLSRLEILVFHLPLPPPGRLEPGFLVAAQVESQTPPIEHPPTSPNMMLESTETHPDDGGCIHIYSHLYMYSYILLTQVHTKLYVNDVLIICKSNANHMHLAYDWYIYIPVICKSYTSCI